jgi:hypothetical protein
MLILNFTYPLRCRRVPPVEYHWSNTTAVPSVGTSLQNYRLTTREFDRHRFQTRVLTYLASIGQLVFTFCLIRILVNACGKLHADCSTCQGLSNAHC